MFTLYWSLQLIVSMDHTRCITNLQEWISDVEVDEGQICARLLHV